MKRTAVSQPATSQSALPLREGPAYYVGQTLPIARKIGNKTGQWGRRLGNCQSLEHNPFGDPFRVFCARRQLDRITPQILRSRPFPSRCQ